jgi:hypothetical protein
VTKFTPQRRKSTPKSVVPAGELFSAIFGRSLGERHYRSPLPLTAMEKVNVRIEETEAVQHGPDARC